MSSKDDEDWLDILGGKSVADADPEIAKEARAFRDVLLSYQEQQDLPPLRLPKTISQHKSPKIHFWDYAIAPVLKVPVWGYAIVSVFIAIVLIPLFVQQTQLPDEIPKSFPFYLELFTAEPQKNAQNIHEMFQKRGITSNVMEEDGIWILDIEFNAAQRLEVIKVLALYQLEFPFGDINQLTVEIKEDEQPTTP